MNTSPKYIHSEFHSNFQSQRYLYMDFDIKKKTSTNIFNFPS